MKVTLYLHVANKLNNQPSISPNGHTERQGGKAQREPKDRKESKQTGQIQDKEKVQKGERKKRETEKAEGGTRKRECE